MELGTGDNYILTHNHHHKSVEDGNLKVVLQEYLNKLDLLEEQNQITFEQKLTYIEFLSRFSEFNLGRFILRNKGINGFWSDYLINYPDIYKKLNHDPYGVKMTPTEKKLLENLPITLANQQRHKIFKKLAQQELKNNIKVLSIPCGLASEILQLDYSSISNIELYGIDIDPESLEIAEQRAKELNLNNYCTWLEEDAWQYNLSNLDLIISNGLTMYVDDDSLVYALYKKFYQSLNTSGKLITSFITPPPFIDSNSIWNLTDIEPPYLELQENIFHRVFSAKWHGYRTPDLITKLLTKAGFKKKNITIYPDFNSIFPTVVAVK